LIVAANLGKLWERGKWNILLAGLMGFVFWYISRKNNDHKMVRLDTQIRVCIFTKGTVINNLPAVLRQH